MQNKTIEPKKPIQGSGDSPRVQFCLLIEYDTLFCCSCFHYDSDNTKPHQKMETIE